MNSLLFMTSPNPVDRKYVKRGYDDFWDGVKEERAPISTYGNCQREAWVAGWRQAEQEFLKKIRGENDSAQA